MAFSTRGAFTACRNNRRTHRALKPLNQALSVLPSFNDQPQQATQSTKQPQDAPASKPAAKGNAAKQSPSKSGSRSKTGP